MAALLLKGIVQTQHWVHLCFNGERKSDFEPQLEEKVTIMAYASAHQTRASGLFGQVADAIASLRTAWARSRVYVRTYNELNALTSRELADLGISRSMVTRLAYEAAYGRDA